MWLIKESCLLIVFQLQDHTRPRFPFLYGLMEMQNILLLSSSCLPTKAYFAYPSDNTGTRKCFPLGMQNMLLLEDIWKTTKGYFASPSDHAGTGKCFPLEMQNMLLWSPVVLWAVWLGVVL